MENPNNFMRTLSEPDLVRLVLPAGFAAVHGPEDLRQISLRFEGDVWSKRLNVVKYGARCFIEGSGWRRALAIYEIRPGYTMKFIYDGVSSFDVYVFNEHNIRLQLNHTEFRIGSEIRRLHIPRENQSDPVPSNEGLLINQEKQPVIINLVDDSSESDVHVATVRKKEASRPGQKKKDAASTSGAVRRRGRPRPRVVRVPRISPHDSVAYQRAIADNPPSANCCCIIMQSSYLRTGKNLVIPQYFAEQQLAGKSTFRTFKVEGKKPYVVECAQYEGGFGRAKASSWNKFASKNKLERGDVIVFRVNRPFRSVWNVAIYKAM